LSHNVVFHKTADVVYEKSCLIWKLAAEGEDVDGRYTYTKVSIQGELGQGATPAWRKLENVSSRKHLLIGIVSGTN